MDEMEDNFDVEFFKSEGALTKRVYFIVGQNFLQTNDSEMFSRLCFLKKLPFNTMRLCPHLNHQNYM